MYRWQIFALLLLSINGVINVTLGGVFQVFSIPLETVDVVAYCDGLESKLQNGESSILLLQVGRPSQVYEIVPGTRNITNASECGPQTESDHVESEVNSMERIAQWIENNEVTVDRHLVVEYITLLTPEGEYLLTLERTGDLEPIGFFPKFGGASTKDKLLLSLVGGGGASVRNFEKLKKT